MKNKRDAVYNECAGWDWRYSESDVSKNMLINTLGQIYKMWVFQKEKGSSGYIHWQGRGSLHKKRRKTPLMNLYAEVGLKVPLFLQPTTTGEFKKQSFSYQMKADTRIEGPWKDTDKAEYIPKQYRISKLLPFQQKIIDIELGARGVGLVINRAGNVGKTTLAHYCALHLGGIVIPALNDSDKLIQCACCILRTKKQRKSCHIFIDIPRSVDQTRLKGMYVAIEQIQTGWTYDWRNCFKQWYMDTPKIWVFCNEAPNIKWLTPDRWKTYDICPLFKTLKPVDLGDMQDVWTNS